MPGDSCIPECDHLAELPQRVDVQQSEGQRGRLECLEGKMQQNGGILANRVQQDRAMKLGRDLAQNVDGFRLKLLQMTAHGRAQPAKANSGIQWPGLAPGPPRFACCHAIAGIAPLKWNSRHDASHSNTTIAFALLMVG